MIRLQNGQKTLNFCVLPILCIKLIDAFGAHTRQAAFKYAHLISSLAVNTIISHNTFSPSATSTTYCLSSRFMLPLLLLCFCISGKWEYTSFLKWCLDIQRSGLSYLWCSRFHTVFRFALFNVLSNLYRTLDVLLHVYKYHIFTGWHCRLSTRGNVVNRDGAEVDSAYRGVTIYFIIPHVSFL